MILPFLLFAQLAVPTDSVYSSAALRALVARAAVENRVPPPRLRGYDAHIESEISLILRDTLGRERAAQIEQLASAARWSRAAEYDMHVVGYRSQGLGAPFSSLTFVRGWTEPTLFGDRLRLGVQFVDSATSRRKPAGDAAGDTIVAVHPLAADRDRYYRFSGGDTITVLRTGNRSISIVRVRVTPHLEESTRLSAFDGEIDLDAERQQIVRMRGRFVILAPPDQKAPLLARMSGLVGVAYAEFVNTEVNGKYWLPAFQRTELQATIGVMGPSRSIVRIVSTFSDYTVDDTSNSTATMDDSPRVAHHTTWASTDSVSRFGDWRETVGVATASVTANDFDDMAPDIWRAGGRPYFDFFPTNIDNVVRFDRVEGLYTGYELNLHLRDLMPGLTIGALGGWAWSEQTLRGGAHASLNRDTWTYGVRAERDLATTNDFIRPFDPQSGGLSALIGSVDDFDYVDRRLALATVTHVIGSIDAALVTAQFGAGDDRADVARLSHGFFGSTSFRPNRGVTEGAYSLGVIDAEFHPGISGDFVQPGVGAKVHYETGHGTLAWQRAEVSVSALQYLGDVSLLMQADGGAVFGANIPPQTLFEMGGDEALPGYAYKEFAGDRAALFRSYASYAFPLWKVPHRFRGNYFIPGVSPGLAIGVDGGWTTISTDAARIAVNELGPPGSTVPVSQATNGIRATAGVALTFFSGFLHVGVARPIDQSAPWRWSIGAGPAF
jgi:hypothetical protein